MRPLLLPLAILIALGYATSAHAMRIVDESVTVDPVTQTMHFALGLDSIPDFDTRDGSNRMKDDFQYWIRYESTEDPIDPIRDSNVLVRGSEIRTSNGIVIREFHGFDPDPNANGWGPLRGVVPYVMWGPWIHFTVPIAMIGDADGVIWYGVGLYRFGATVDYRFSRSDSPPVATRKNTWGRLKALYR